MAQIAVASNAADILELYLDFFSLEGHNVIKKSFGQGALKELCTDPPDLVLLDFPLGLDEEGSHFLKKVREHPATQLLPVLLCTTMPRAVEQQRDFLERNRVHVLVKPFELEELSRMVNAALTGG